MSRITALPLARRQPGPAAPVALSEVFVPTVADAAGPGFVLAQLAGRKGPILWIQDRLSRREAGRPYVPGLPPDRALLLVQVPRPADVLTAAEEGLRCRTLAAVVAEVLGDPGALTFAATKRLAVRAEAAGVPCWLIRQGGTADLSAARDRWRVTALPSSANPDDPRAPGLPRWRVELFRSRDKRPGVWVASHDPAGDEGAADRFRLSAAVPDPALADGAGAAGQRTFG